MSDLAVKILGKEEAVAKIRVVKEAAQAALLVSVRGGGLVVERYAKTKSPIETGSLRRSIHVEILEVDRDHAAAIIGTDLVYAAQVEFGGEIHAKNAPFLVFKTKDGQWHSVKSVTQIPQPYLRPALDENIAEIVEVMRSVFERLIMAAVA